jgi:hypothetical protein
VIDYDAANRTYYHPVDLDDPFLVAADGLEPSESDPRFHQQMVYAVASQVVEMFERALGREIHWRRGDRTASASGVVDWDKVLAEDIKTLYLFPHALNQANAFYSPDVHGIMFGYFRANLTDQGNNLPGQRVFTCLSADIIAHEMTHAIVDGIRAYFLEATNPDVLAFHEGFADLAALFAHFSHAGALLDAIQRTGGRLYSDELSPDAGAVGGATPDEAPSISGETRRTNPLVQLAMQFGQARGGTRGLRQALGTTPGADDINTRIDDPHFRGSILVAAVFDAYFTCYTNNTAYLFRTFRAGYGVPTDNELPAPLAEALAERAAELAQYFFRLCARALDFCPPVDVTFGNFLRALITTVVELDEDDHRGVRDALMQAFRSRGIYSESASFFSQDALAWPRADLPNIHPQEIKDPATGRVKEMGLVFGGQHGLTTDEKDINGRVLRSWAGKHRRELGLDPELEVVVPSFHPMHRILEDGRLHIDMIVELIQTRRVPLDPAVPAAGFFTLRGGTTLIVAAPQLGRENGRTIMLDPEVRFSILKPLHGATGDEREESQRNFAMSQGGARGFTGEDQHFRADFGALHEEVR